MRGIDRRSVLKVAAVATAASLVGCTNASRSVNRLRVGFPTAAARETLDPHRSSLFVEQARAKALFDTLVGYTEDMGVVPRLAELWEANPSGIRWRIKLREARFHDSRLVTAEDVLYSYRRIAEPATASPAMRQFAGVDFAASRALSANELELTLMAPNFEFPLAWAAPGAEIVPANTTDFTAPVGTGPFQFRSFRAGGSAVFARFDGHWNGLAKAAELEFVPINDETARVAALISGQVDYAHDLSMNSAALLEKDPRTEVVATRNGTMQAVAFKVDRPPFDDPRLLRAVLSGVDRQSLVEVALSGHGLVGNDLFGKGLKYYPADIPQRVLDVDFARSLVKQSDAYGTEFDLHTSSVDPYFESAATLLAQQLDDIGLRATLRVGPPETYFSDIMEVNGAAHTRTSALPVPTFLEQRMLAGAASTNYTGYWSPEFDELFTRALGTAAEAERARLLADAQRLARESSGLLVWGFSDWNVGIARDLAGIRPAPPNSLDWARFDQVG